MKLGSFVIGGLAGAAVVMMIRRNERMSAVAATVGRELKRRVNGMKDDAVGKAINMKFASSVRRTDGDGRAKSASSKEEDLETVKHLISQDPEASKAIHSILEENEHRRL